MAVTYTRGKPDELGEIRDFINMVFSMHTRPHDFARMLPKLYADDAATAMPISAMSLRVCGQSTPSLRTICAT